MRLMPIVAVWLSACASAPLSTKPPLDDRRVLSPRFPGRVFLFEAKLVASAGGHGSSAVETMVMPIVEWLKGH